MSSAFLRMSTFGVETARRMSMTISCMTYLCASLSSAMRSKTMSLTLLSD